MHYKIVYLPGAVKDLRDLLTFYSYLSGKTEAKNITDFIQKQIHTLVEFPDLGSSTNDTLLDSMGFRKLLVSYSSRLEFVAIIKHIDDSLYVYCIANTRQNYINHLKTTV